MDATETAREFANLSVAIYRHLYPRRDPRRPRISGEALAMLAHLRDTGPLTIGEAARHFDRSQSSVSERIGRLRARGLVTEIRDERDRRRHLVWLTPAGEELLAAELEVLSTDLLAGAARRMAVADRRALVRGMRALLEAARGLAGNERRKKHGR